MTQCVRLEYFSRGREEHQERSCLLTIHQVAASISDIAFTKLPRCLLFLLSLKH